MSIPYRSKWISARYNLDSKYYGESSHKKFKQILNKMLKYFGNFPAEKRDENGKNGLVVAMNIDNGKFFRIRTSCLFPAIISWVWTMVMTLCYDAISRNVNGLGYSPFLVFSITSSTILPSCVFILATQDKIGRKALASGALFVSGLFTISSGIFQASMEKPQPMIILALAVVARLSVNVAYNSGAQYAVELIPVVVRGQGVSAIHVAGYAASFFSPQILLLSSIWKPSPDVILGNLLILGAVACLFLPETLDKVLPVTLEDGELFGEGEGIFEFSFYKNSKTNSTMQLVVK